MSRRILILSVNNFKDLTGVDATVSEKVIVPELLAAQDIVIMQILGSRLYNKILDLIDANQLGLEANAMYKTLVKDYIYDTLANYAMGNLPDAISYRFTNKGVQSPTSSDGNTVSDSMINKVADKYKVRATFYAERLRMFIIENQNDSFKEYFEAGNISDVHPAKRVYKSPIFLGNVKRGKQGPNNADY